MSRRSSEHSSQTAFSQFDNVFMSNNLKKTSRSLSHWLHGTSNRRANVYTIKWQTYTKACKYNSFYSPKHVLTGKQNPPSFISSRRDRDPESLKLSTNVCRSQLNRRYSIKTHHFVRGRVRSQPCNRQWEQILENRSFRNHRVSLKFVWNLFMQLWRHLLATLWYSD